MIPKLPIVALVSLLALFHNHMQAASTQDALKQHKIDAGVVVFIGSSFLNEAMDIAKSKRFLVQVLTSNHKSVQAMRKKAMDAGHSGLLSIRSVHDYTRLPFADDLVNVLVIHKNKNIERSEALRVVRPLGLVIQDGKQQQKPWPKEIDGWTHPRYDASNNAVSNDSQLGPVRNLRWVTGPMHSMGNFVSHNGRNFYGTVQARDAFNGILLWHRKINSQNTATKVAPVAYKDKLLVVHNKTFLALNASSGETVFAFDLGKENDVPLEIMADGNLVVGVGSDSIQGFDANSGKRLWHRSLSVPACVITTADAVFCTSGNKRRGEVSYLHKLNRSNGKTIWSKNKKVLAYEKSDYDWIPNATACIHKDGVLVFEVSTVSDFPSGSGIHVVEAKTGKHLWSRAFRPLGSHYIQSRSLISDNLIWVTVGFGPNGNIKGKWEGMNIRTGKIEKSFDSGYYGHCYPPIGSKNYFISGELTLTNITSGKADTHRITKGVCSRVAGMVPAHGMLNVSPSGCICWPMLKGHASLAPLGSFTEQLKSKAEDFKALRFEASIPKATSKTTDSWPSYRANPQRSASTNATLSKTPSVKWQANVKKANKKHLFEWDWHGNPFVRENTSQAVSAGDMIIVAQGSSHSLQCFSRSNGDAQWRFIADGQIDGAPTIYNNAVYVGTRSGTLHCIRLDNGAPVWELQVAPGSSQIVGYGQMSSPWPVSASVLAVDNTIYCVAGRHQLMDEGVRVVAVDAATGAVKWAQVINKLWDGHKYYHRTGFEFDPIDIPVLEGDQIAVSRWLFNKETGAMTEDYEKGFALMHTNNDIAIAPRGSWTYGTRSSKEGVTKRRPLVAFAGNQLYMMTNNRKGLFRKDFNKDVIDAFNFEWKDGRAPVLAKRAGKVADMNRSERLAHGAAWKQDNCFDAPAAAMLLTNDALYVISEKGTLSVSDINTGKITHRLKLPAAPSWDSLIAVGTNLYYTTKDGRLICLE